MKRLWFVLLLVATAALATDQRPPVGKQRPAIERVALQRPAGAEGGASPFCPCYSAASMAALLGSCSENLTGTCNAPSITFSPYCSTIGGGGAASSLGTFTAVAGSGQCVVQGWDIMTGDPITTTIATTPTQFADCESILTPLCPLAAPAGLATSGATLSTIDTSWNAVTGAAGYMVLKDAASPITQATNATYTWTGLTASTTYQFTARTKNAAGVYGLSTSNVPGTTSSTLSSGLIAYYGMNETSGTRDDSVGAADLTDNNTVLSAGIGVVGTVAAFSTSPADYLSNAAPIIATNSSFSICGWFYRNSVSDGGIINIDNGSLRPYNIDVSGNTIRTYPNASAFVSVAAGPSGQWQFVCGVLNFGESTYGRNHLYLNAVDSGTPQDLGGTFVATNVPFRIGARPAFGDNASPFQMTRWGVWQKALSIAEQQSLMNSGTGKLYSELTAGDKTSLLAYWNLDEASGNRADSHSTYTLTDNNTVVSATSQPGRKGGAAAAVFASATTESLTSTDAGLDAANTHAFWFKKGGTSFPSSDGVVTHGSSARGLEFYGNAGAATGRCVVHQSNTGEITAVTAAPVVDGNWHLIVLWHDPAALRVRCTVDNGTVAEAAYDGTVLANPGTFTVGGWSFAWFDGTIDEVGLWNRVLTPAERTELYNAGAGKFYPY